MSAGTLNISAPEKRTSYDIETKGEGPCPPWEGLGVGERGLKPTPRVQSHICATNDLGIIGLYFTSIKIKLATVVTACSSFAGKGMCVCPFLCHFKPHPTPMNSD